MNIFDLNSILIHRKILFKKEITCEDSHCLSALQLCSSAGELVQGGGGKPEIYESRISEFEKSLLIKETETLL